MSWLLALALTHVMQAHGFTSIGSSRPVSSMHRSQVMDAPPKSKFQQSRISHAKVVRSEDVQMCGFMAVYDSTLSFDALRLKTLQLQRTLRHRGPDGSGIHTVEGKDAGRSHCIAHERLAIVDPLSGNQPLYSHDGQMSLAVNGEIYNHIKLRDGLKDQTPFKTGSDCEVIVHLYQEVGDDVASHLDGDFAFVIVDESTGHVYAARDPMGVNSMYIGYGADGSVWFASEMKALANDVERVEIFPPGYYYSSRDGGKMVRYYDPEWQQLESAQRPLDLATLRSDFTKAVDKRMMSDVPYGVLLSGGLDSSLVASVTNKLLQQRAAGGDAPMDKLKTFCIGLEGSPDLAAAQSVADFLGTEHYGFEFTIQEGIDAVSDVIYHLETYDVTTIRAGTPMYLLARKIKGLGIKMVLSGEGADESLAGYLYFHKAPNPTELHEECVRKMLKLHQFDCLRANKATMAWGLEVRVPFLDKFFMDTTMNTDPALKMTDTSKEKRTQQYIEKWMLRQAFDVEEAGEAFLPPEVLWRQKEQFSDGVGYDWIDGLKAFANRIISDAAFDTREERFPINPPQTKEAYYIRSLFDQHFPQWSAASTVPGGATIACSSPTAIRWDESWAKMADPSGRAVGSHVDAVDEI